MKAGEPKPLRLHRSKSDIALAELDSRLGCGRPGGLRYNSDRMAFSSRKRIAPSLLVSAITKRTRPCLEVSA